MNGSIRNWRLARRGLAGAGLALLAAPAARGQIDALRIVVNYPPGGALDGTARLMAEQAMRQDRGAVVVENRPGAGGNIGAAFVARAPADGRTVLAGLSTLLTLNPHLFSDPGFDIRRGLDPFAMLGLYSLVLLVHPATGITTLEQFVARARQQPMFYASGGVGSPGHLAMEHLRQFVGLPQGALEHAAQRGNAEALTAMIAGTVPAGFLAIGGGPGLVRSGRLRAIAVSGTARAPLLPEVPTVSEAGHPGFDIRIANVLLSPAGTPAAAKAAWMETVRATLADPAAQARLAAWGIDPPSGDLAAFLAANGERWAKVVREAGIRPQ